MNSDGWVWECQECAEELFAWHKKDIRRAVEEHQAEHVASTNRSEETR